MGAPFMTGLIVMSGWNHLSRCGHPMFSPLRDEVAVPGEQDPSHAQTTCMNGHPNVRSPSTFVSPQALDISRGFVISTGA